MEEILYISKRDMSLKEALVNKAFLWGESPFTTTRISHGHVVLWQYHRVRLEKMIRYFYPEIELENVIGHIEKTVKNIAIECRDFESVYLRITLFEISSSKVEFFILATEKNIEDKALKLKLLQQESFSGHPTFVKNGNYSLNFKQKNDVNKNGFDDIIYFNKKENILDLTTSNIIFYKNGTYFTSELTPGVLDGTTRSAFLDFLGDKNLSIREELLKLEDLSSYEEAFCLNSFSGIRRVDSIDNIIYNDSMTTNIIKEFNLKLKGVTND